MKVALISDIHGNFEALKTLWPQILQCDKVLNAGDISGYYPFINEVIQKLKKEKKIHSVLGNHDKAMLFGKPSNFSPVLQEAINYQKTQISKENLNFLKELPESLIFNLEGKKLGLFHGGPSGIDDRYYPNSDLSNLADLGYDLLVLGHTHWPMVRKIKNSVVVNPGSVGQPRDGDARTSMMVYDTTTERMINIRKKYNLSVVKDKIHSANLNRKLMEMLTE